MRIHEISDTKPSELGTYLPNILNSEPGERILFMLITDDYSGELLFAFENGKASRIPLIAYETKQNRKKLIRACYEGSPIVSILYLTEPVTLPLFRLYVKRSSFQAL